MRIRWARELLEPNRTEFARKVGMDMTTLRSVEIGKINPGLQLAWQIIHSLHISLDYVVAGRLTGVHPEMAARLVAAHPELAPPQLPIRRADIPDTTSQANTPAMMPPVY